MDVLTAEAMAEAALASENAFLERFRKLGKDSQHVCWGIGIDSLAAALGRTAHDCAAEGEELALSDADLLELAKRMETDGEIGMLMEQAGDRLQNIIYEFLDPEPEEEGEE